MRVGDFVECIDDSFQPGTPPFFVKGQIYQIIGKITCITCRRGQDDQIVEGLRFADMDMATDDYMLISRFCPIIDRSLEGDGITIANDLEEEPENNLK